MKLIHWPFVLGGEHVEPRRRKRLAENRGAENLVMEVIQLEQLEEALCSFRLASGLGIVF